MMAAPSQKSNDTAKSHSNILSNSPPMRSVKLRVLAQLSGVKMEFDYELPTAIFKKESWMNNIVDAAGARLETPERKDVDLLYLQWGSLTTFDQAGSREAWFCGGQAEKLLEVGQIVLGVFPGPPPLLNLQLASYACRFSPLHDRERFAGRIRGHLQRHILMNHLGESFLPEVHIKEALNHRSIARLFMEDYRDNIVSYREQSIQYLQDLAVSHVPRTCWMLLAACLLASIKLESFWILTCRHKFSDKSPPFNNTIQEDNAELTTGDLSNEAKSFIEKETTWLEKLRPQWRMVTPYRFRQNDGYFAESQNHVLPISPITNGVSRAGVFTEERIVRIEPSYQDFCAPLDSLFCLKTIIADEQFIDNVWQEIKQAPRMPPMPHLMNSLQAWSSPGHIEILFPVPMTNLRELMRSSPPSNWIHSSAQKCLLPIFAQMEGLASALEYLHCRPGNEQSIGWHFDLRPEKILIFEYSDGYPIFKIGELQSQTLQDGLHTMSTQNQQIRTDQGNQAIFGAPEIFSGSLDSKALVGTRPVDVWALGCIFLELCIWLISSLTIAESGNIIQNRISISSWSDWLDTLSAWSISLSNEGMGGLVPLIREMLRPDPSQRITVKDVKLQMHKFLQERATDALMRRIIDHHTMSNLVSPHIPKATEAMLYTEDDFFEGPPSLSESVATLDPDDSYEVQAEGFNTYQLLFGVQPHPIGMETRTGSPDLVTDHGEAKLKNDTSSSAPSNSPGAMKETEGVDEMVSERTVDSIARGNLNELPSGHNLELAQQLREIEKLPMDPRSPLPALGTDQYKITSQTRPTRIDTVSQENSLIDQAVRQKIAAFSQSPKSGSGRNNSLWDTFTNLEQQSCIGEQLSQDAVSNHTAFHVRGPLVKFWQDSWRTQVEFSLLAEIARVAKPSSNVWIEFLILQPVRKADVAGSPFPVVLIVASSNRDLRLVKRRIKMKLSLMPVGFRIVTQTQTLRLL